MYNTSTLHGVLTCMGSSARSSVLTVVPALVDLTPVPHVARLAATLGHLASVEEAAPAVQTLDITGLRGRSCGENPMVINVGSESKPPRVCIKYVTLKQICFSVSLPPGITVPAYRLQHIDISFFHHFWWLHPVWSAIFNFGSRSSSHCILNINFDPLASAV